MGNKLLQEFEYALLNYDKPSKYFNELIEKSDFLEKYPFNMIKDLINVPQSKQHHPEGSVWNHTMMVIDEASKVKSKSKDERVFMWAALLHDIGKTQTTKIRKGKVTSYNHDKIGAIMVEEFFTYFNENPRFIKTVKNLVKYHMHILFVVKNMPYGDINSMIKESDIDEIALLGLSDRLGRGDMAKENIEKEKNNVKMFLELSKKYKSKLKH